MPFDMPLDNIAQNLSLNTNEQIEIKKKVSLEIFRVIRKMVELGGITNILAGLFVVWTLRSQTSLFVLLTWYLALFIINGINMVWAFYYRNKNTPDAAQSWFKVFYFIIAGLCLTWGIIGIIFASSNLYYQLYAITFLQIVVIGFSFGTAIEFTTAFIAINCLLIPTIIFRIYKGTQSLLAVHSDPSLNLTFGISLLILGSFLLVASYIGARLIKQFFTASFANVFLSKKLENMNKFLEQRVQERTLELENSLKLVTFQATHDLLTNLPNHRLLEEYTEVAIITASKQKNMFAVVFFALNEIDKINDGLGHHIGDLIIQTVAQRFQALFERKLTNSHTSRYTLTLSRKDEFVILIEPVTNSEEVEAKAKILFSILDEPIHTQKQTIKLTASVGISLYPLHGKDIKTLLMNADAAMMYAKRVGGNNLNIYKAEINAEVSKQLEMENSLHGALRNSEFLLQYQPFINLKTGLVCGAEALVRWKNPTMGFVSPMNFIPLTESIGLIVPIGEWVLRTACLQTKEWLDQGYPPLKIAVNLSAKQLQQKNILQIVADILAETQLPPHCLELELTESEAFKEEVFPVLKAFKTMGLSLSIDDFGTGYSGLSNLKTITIDKLKIDKSFVQDAPSNAESSAIVTNIIALAKKMHIATLAEGVETKEQLQFLMEQGCDMIQGYYFSRPLDPEDFIELLKSKRNMLSDVDSKS